MRRSFRPFAADAQHPADRRAQFLVLAVDAAKPTTRPPLSLQQLGFQSLDVLAPRFGFLRPEHPADPFIAGKRGEVFPRSENLWVGNQDASQNPPGLYVPLRRRSPWSSSIAHRSLDAVEGSLEVGAAPSARLIGDLVRDEAGQRAKIVLSSRPMRRAGVGCPRSSLRSLGQAGV